MNSEEFSTFMGTSCVHAEAQTCPWTTETTHAGQGNRPPASQPSAQTSQDVWPVTARSPTFCPHFRLRVLQLTRHALLTECTGAGVR